jgi:RNA polymerase sigma-70 factor (ECF subfamily)
MLDGEQHIVRAAIRGEASAFGALYDHYQPAIYRFILFKVGRREDAEDLTHHVFLRAWERIRSYKPRGYPFSSFLYRIARNQIIDHYRAKRETTPIEELELTLAAAPETAQHIDARLETDRVRKVLHEMKTEYQDVIILRFIEELSVEEAAVALGKSAGAVKVLQHRALKKLRELLNETTPDSPLVSDTISL